MPWAIRAIQPSSAERVPRLRRRRIMNMIMALLLFIQITMESACLLHSRGKNFFLLQ